MCKNAATGKIQRRLYFCEKLLEVLEDDIRKIEQDDQA